MMRCGVNAENIYLNNLFSSDKMCSQVAMATGQVLFQRFYYSKSFVRHAMEPTAMGCVCLASKIEEAPRRIRDVINVFHHIKQVKSQK